MTPNEEVRKRSEGRCEAFIQIGDTWTRCWKGPVEVHHTLTRARGGKILDEIGETYHLIALCPRCHRAADGSDAYESGLLMDGYVTTGTFGPVYTGSDEYLSHKYSGEPG